MRVLSLFDGMACGALALQAAGIAIESYDAFEIDKYAIKTSTHNFPFVKHHGDVFDADFTQFRGVDILCGGSPCTYWSIAQKNNRETEASGMGWELFQQYVRAIREAEPKYFVYENNKSMSKQIRASIDEAFGFEAVLINSALVSAQNRQRLYWVGKRNADGTYSKVVVEQPKDRGIVLKDILESGVVDREKAYPLLTTHQGNARDYFKKQHAQIVLEPTRIPEYGVKDKSRPITASYAYKGDGVGSLASEAFPDNPNKQVRDYVAEPVCVDGIGSDKMIPPCGQRGQEKSRTITAGYHICSQRDLRMDIETDGFMGKQGVIEVVPHNGLFEEEGCSFYLLDKDGKKMTVYRIENGFITIKGKQYPIKLEDGFYIIRKLTVRECMRLQTVPEWYEFPVSNAQAYKMLGNGWTVDVIAHIFTQML